MALDGRFSLAEAAEILAVPRETLARWVRGGLLAACRREGGQRLLDFHDLIAARAARDLLGRGLSERVVRRNLTALRAILPGLDRPLSRMRVASDGEHVVVVADDVAFEPLSGQVVMDFLVDGLVDRAAEVLALPRTRATDPACDGPEGVSAWGLFRRACALEEAGRLGEAEAAYRQALARDPELAGAHTNLGNLAYAAGRRGEARALYERALALDPGQVEARFNLANLLDGLGETGRALAEWRQVCATAPDFADAHFNLGLAEARAGRLAAASAALEAFLERAPDGEPAAAARALLARLDRRARPFAAASHGECT